MLFFVNFRNVIVGKFNFQLVTMLADGVLNAVPYLEIFKQPMKYLVRASIGLFSFFVASAASFNGISARVCTQSYTTINDVVITESAVGDFSIGAGKILLIAAPSGFEFDPSSPIGFTNNSPNNFAINSVLFITASTLAIGYEINNNNQIDAFGISNIRIRAASVSGATGNFVFAPGSSAIAGISNGTTAFQVQSALSSINFSTVTAKCNNELPFPLGGSFTLGTGVSSGPQGYSGSPGVSGSNFNPSAATVGTNNVVYTVNTNSPTCAFTRNISIDVNAAPIVTMITEETGGNFMNDGVVCTNDDITFTGYGANTYQIFKTSGPTLLSSSSPYTTSTLNNGDVIYIEGTATNGCKANSSQQNIVINSLPAAPTFNPTKNTFSSSDPGFWLDTLGTPAEEANRSTGSPSYFTGPGVIYDSGDDRYYFYPNVAGDGTHLITYHFVDGSGCESTTDKSFVVGTGVSAGAIQNINTKYCEYDANSTIYVDFCASCFFGCTAYIGMEYSADNGATWNPMIPASTTPQGSCIFGTTTRYSYTLSPSTLGAGTRLFRYSYSSTFIFLSTRFSPSQTTTIYPRPTISITNSFPTVVCSDFPTTQLTYTANGASGTATFSSTVTGFVTFSSPNYFANWNAAGAVLDSVGKPISLTFVDNVSGCSNTITKNVPVALKPSTPTPYNGVGYFVGQTFPYTFCSNQGTYAVANVVQGVGMTMQWSRDFPNNPPVFSDNYYPTFTNFAYFPRGLISSDETYFMKQYKYNTCVSDASAPYILAVNPPVSVNIGQYNTVCSNQTISLNKLQKTGPAVTQTWSTVTLPSGTFDNNTSNTPTYTLHPTDITRGSVTFRVTTSDPDGPQGCPLVTKDTVVSITELPTISATSTKPVYCSNDLIELKATVSKLVAAPVTWYKGPIASNVQTGLLTPTQLSTDFVPNGSEKTGGSITFFVQSSDPDGTGPCSAVDANITIAINPEAVVAASIGDTICGGSNINLVGTCTLFGGGNLGATWNGTGVIPWSSYLPGTTNPKNATYSPTTAEAGGSTLLFNLVSDDPDGAGPCKVVTQSSSFKINQAPVVVAGADATYCSNTSPVLTASLAGGSATAVTWTKNAGSGTIVNPGLATTTYTVVPGDNATGVPLFIDFTATTNDPDDGGPCVPASDVMRIRINPHVTVDAGADIEVCANQPVQLNGTVKIGGANRTGAGYNTWKTFDGLGTFSLTAPANLVGTYNPDGVITSSGFNVVEGTGELGLGDSLFAYLVTLDPDTAGPCLADSARINIKINPLPITHFDPATRIQYCGNDDAVFLFGNLGSIYLAPGNKNSASFEGINALNGTYVVPFGSAFKYDPEGSYSINPNGGPDTVRYSYADAKGCVNYVDTVFRLFPYPLVNFNISTLCEKDTITFTQTATISNLNNPATANNRYDWTIDSDTIQNVFAPVQSSLNTPVARYSFVNYGLHNIKLKVTSVNGAGNINCFNTKDSTRIFGPYPATNFAWDRPCSVDSIVFTNLTTIPTGYSNSITWNMNGAGAYKVNGVTMTNANSLNPRYKFASPNIYNVELDATTNLYNCKKVIRKEVYVLPTITITDANPYDTTFRSAGLNWAPSGANYSWAWGTPSGKDVINPAFNTWITNLNGNYNLGELSYLNSPCFNFRSLDKPMISLKTWNNSTNLAGAMLEATTGYMQPWNSIGQIGQGLNWYNTSGIVGLIGVNSNNPLAQGFSGENTNWGISRIGLSQYALRDSLVRFRLVFGSSAVNDPLNQKDGIAFDSVWIGNRTKMILMEHFTNSSSSVSAQTTPANAAVDAMRAARPADVALLSYHTSFPSIDPFSLVDGVDPGVSSRVLYYGVSNVPRTVVDGTYYNGNTYSGGTPETRLDVDDIDSKALETARFKVDINSSITTGQVNVGVKVTYADNSTLSNRVIVHTVVVEDSASGINSMNGVVRKMMPTAAGKVITINSWAKDSSATVYNSWSNSLPPTAKLGIVVFIQDATTKEIYQAKYVRGSQSSSIVDGTEDALESALSVQLFPNPATDEAFVLFGDKTRSSYQWMLVDALGKVVQQGTSQAGAQGFALDTREQSAGVYSLQLTDSAGRLSSKKLIIVK